MFPSINSDLELYMLLLTFRRTFHCPYETVCSLLLNSGQQKKKGGGMLLACESLEFQICYPLGSVLFLLCWDFQRFRLGFQVCFSWQTILLFLFFSFLAFPWLLKLFSPEKVLLFFHKPFSRLAKFEILFLFIGIFRFYKKEMYSNYLNLSEFILRIFKSLRHSLSLLNLTII